MPTAPQSWTRPHHTPGGGDAGLFYAAFIEAPADWSISGSTYRTAGIPPGIDVMAYGPDMHPEVVEGFRSGPLWDICTAEQPALAEAVRAARGCVLLRGGIPDPMTLDYHRDLIGILQWLADRGAAAILDLTAATWWSPEAWRAQVFAPDAPQPRRHVMIHVSDEPGGTLWLHTRGLVKYGRPDISLRGVPEEAKPLAAQIVNRFIELQALGGLVPEGQPIRMDGVPDGMRVAHGGAMDDPDFNNVHFEMIWPA